MQHAAQLPPGVDDTTTNMHIFPMLMQRKKLSISPFHSGMGCTGPGPEYPRARTRRIERGKLAFPPPLPGFLKLGRRWLQCTVISLLFKNYLCLAVLGLHWYVSFSVDADSRGCSLVAGRELLLAVGSLVRELGHTGFSSCRSWALQRRLNRWDTQT